MRGNIKDDNCKWCHVPQRSSKFKDVLPLCTDKKVMCICAFMHYWKWISTPTLVSPLNKQELVLFPLKNIALACPLFWNLTIKIIHVTECLKQPGPDQFVWSNTKTHLQRIICTFQYQFLYAVPLSPQI